MKCFPNIFFFMDLQFLFSEGPTIVKTTNIGPSSLNILKCT